MCEKYLLHTQSWKHLATCQICYQNHPPSYIYFVDGRTPAGGGTKLYELLLSINVDPRIYCWPLPNILSNFFLTLKVRKNAKNAKTPPSYHYFNKYLKWWWNPDKFFLQGWDLACLLLISRSRFFFFNLQVVYV